MKFDNGTMALRVEAVERTTLRVPFDQRLAAQLRRWFPGIRLVDVFEVTLSDGSVGIGEELREQTWAETSDQTVVVGRSLPEAYASSEAGAGLTMALRDAEGKAKNCPVWALLGESAADTVGVSWWAPDLPATKWADTVTTAADRGYTHAKLKARPWCDVLRGVRLADAAAPDGFSVALDFNELLSANESTVAFLRELSEFDCVKYIESPVPENKTEGYQWLSCRIPEVSLAAHFGESSVRPVPAPDPETLRTSGVGVYVGGGGPSDAHEQDTLLSEHGLTGYFQLRGTGLSLAYAVHTVATLSAMTLPVVVRQNVYEHSLTAESLTPTDGRIDRIDADGLGVEVDWEALDRYTVADPTPAEPRVLVRVDLPSGEYAYFTRSWHLSEAVAAGRLPGFGADTTFDSITREAAADTRRWDEVAERARSKQGVRLNQRVRRR